MLNTLLSETVRSCKAKSKLKYREICDHRKEIKKAQKEIDDSRKLMAECKRILKCL